MGPRSGLDGQKTSSPPRFDPGPSSLYSIAIPTELPGLLHHIKSAFKTTYQHVLFILEAKGVASGVNNTLFISIIYLAQE